MISHHQRIDYSLLSRRKKFQSDWTKNNLVIAKKRMLIYGIIDILRAILAKYQYFFNETRFIRLKYYQITYSLQFSVQYHVKCGF